MSLWKSFGASVRGPGHVATGKPNEDAWASFHHAWGDGIVVSDGLGSKPFAEIGSKAACLAVAYAVNACRDKSSGDHDFVFNCINASWLSLVSPLEPDDCAATCLFAYRRGDGAIHLGRLGDGLSAAVTANGSIVHLPDENSHGFSNITVGLSPRTSAQDWRYLSLPEEQCAAVLLCTDGVADDLENVDGFVAAFIGAHRNLAAILANRYVHKMLEDWPTPKHSDDKTVACLCRDEVADE